MGDTHFSGNVIANGVTLTGETAVDTKMRVFVYFGSVGNSETAAAYIPAPDGYNMDLVSMKLSGGTVTNDPQVQAGDSAGGGDIVIAGNISITGNIMDCTISGTAPTVLDGGFMYLAVTADADDAITRCGVLCEFDLTAV